MNKRFVSAMLTMAMLSTLMPNALADGAQQAAEVPQVAAAVAAQDQQPVEEEPAAETEEAQEEEQQESEEPAEEEIQVQAGEDEEEAPVAAMSGNCGVEGHETEVTWALEENNDPLYYVVSGDNGSSQTHRFYEDDSMGGDRVQAYTLTISGEGAMADYERHTTPWGLELAKMLNANGTTIPSNQVSEIASPRITRVVFAADSSLTHIGSHAFRSTSIRSFEIPASVECIGDYALIQCRHLSSITAEPTTVDRPFYVEDNVIYENYTTDSGEAGLALRFFPLARTGSYTIPEGVTALGSNSMQMAQVSAVTIPTSVRSVNSYALNFVAATTVTFL